MNPSKMASYGLTPQDVRDALNKENVELPSGKVVGTATELTVNTVGKFTNEAEFKI